MNRKHGIEHIIQQANKNREILKHVIANDA